MPADTAGAGGEGIDCCAGDSGSTFSPGNGGDEGRANEGGAGGENALGFEVLSTTPSDAAAAVERDEAIEVTFSSPIDSASVTPESFAVVGPAGVVSGTLSVTGERVTFEPNAPWALLSDYTVTLSRELHGTDGDALEAVYSFGFESRDGVFGRPRRVTTTELGNMQVIGGASGHVAVIGSYGTAPRTTATAIFDPRARLWGELTPLESDSLNDYSSASLGFNNGGHAFAIFGDEVRAWSRYDGTGWSAARAEELDGTRFAALADDETAMTFWAGVVGNDLNVYAQSLSANNNWSSVKTLASGARSLSIQRLDDGFVTIHKLAADGEYYSTVYDPKAGWGSPKQITHAGSYGVAAHGDAAAVFLWTSTSDVLHAAEFDGKSWTSEELGTLRGYVDGASGRNGHAAAWCSEGVVYASRYDSKSGWSPRAKLGTTDEVEPAARASVDTAGNALVAWVEGSSVNWRRAAHSSADWASVQHIEEQDPAFVRSAVAPDSGEVMLVWWNPLGLWASRFE